MANYTIANTLRIILMLRLPKIFSNFEDDLRIIYMIRILMKSYSSRKDNRLCMVPAPAISRKARGTIEATSGGSSYNSVIPKIISKAQKIIIKDPATAKEFTSIPKRTTIFSPKKKEATIITAATKEAFF